MITRSPWLPFDETIIHRIPETTGVFELGDMEKNVIFLGCADHVDLRQRLLEVFTLGGRSMPPTPRWFRYEETYKPHTVFRSIVRDLRSLGTSPIHIDF
ncbi:MAG: hypothetical protein KC466_01525 [Myxococcales bacterium]|nr:hypothetical protein [Myxococcales bacterium]